MNDKKSELKEELNDIFEEVLEELYAPTKREVTEAVKRRAKKREGGEYSKRELTKAIKNLIDEKF